MLLLMAYPGKIPDEDYKAIRDYQRTQWGINDPKVGDTCLIELSGLPARSFRTPRDRESFRDDRIEMIYRRLLVSKPKFAVIYGKSQKKYWLKFLKSKGLQLSNSDSTLKIESTTVLFTLHPVRSPGNQYWIDWSTTLR